MSDSAQPKMRPWRERGDRWYCRLCLGWDLGCNPCDEADADEQGPHPGQYVGTGTVIEQCLTPVEE